MKFGNVSFCPKHCVDMTKDQFRSFFTGRHKKHVDSYWKEFSKEVAKFKPNKTKRVKKDNRIKKEDVFTEELIEDIETIKKGLDIDEKEVVKRRLDSKDKDVKEG